MVDRLLVLTIFASLLLAATVLLTLVLAIIGWLRSRSPGALYFGFMQLAASFWALCELGELLAQEAAAALRWAQFSYLGIATLPVLWFLFALDYSGRLAYLDRRLRGLIFLLPLVTIALVFTNASHGLIWQEVIVVSEPRLDLHYEHGLWFWIHTVYSYTLLLLGTVELLVAVLRAPLIYRRQVLVVLSGALIPWLSNLVYLTDFVVLPGIDSTPVAFSLTGLIYTLGLWRVRIFDLAPLARDAVVEYMDAGVLLLDAELELVDANPAAVRLLEIPQPLPAGQPILAVRPELAVLQQGFAHGDDRVQELVLTNDHQRVLEVQVKRLLAGRSQPGGWLLILQDVTAMRSAEKTLQTSEESYRTLVENSGVPMILTSLHSGQLILANARAYEYLQVAREEILGRLSTEFYQDPQRRAELLESLERDGQVDGFNLQIRTHDGREIWLLLSARRIYYQGEPAILSFFQDITQQRQRMRQLEYAWQEADNAREMAEINARQLQKALSAVEALATTDDLTGAYNRRRFAELMGHELSMVKRYSRPAAVIMFDLDGFKQVNDAYGHQAGDDVLRVLSKLLMENLRRSDYLVRWGGDEFIILAPEIPPGQASQLAEKIRQLIIAAEFPVVGRMSASLGVTTVRPVDDLDSVVLRVDRALYRAKQLGGNQVYAELEAAES